MYDLKNTMDTQTAMAENYDIDRKIIYLINWGYYFLSDGDTKYPLRSKETTQVIVAAAQQAQTDKDLEEHAISHIVYKDTDKNYYYFPSTTEAGE
jgi:ribosomal protein L30E